MNYLLINDQLEAFKAQLDTTHKEHLTRLIEQCRLYENEPLSKEHPTTSITYMGMAAANLSLAYLLTEQEHYLIEAKRWIFTAVEYDVWGYGFLVDVDLSASWLLFGLGLSYDWLKGHLSELERKQFLNKLILQGNKIFDYGQENLGHCWSTNYWQNHNWINYSGLLTTAYAVRSEYEGSEKWISEIKDNFDKVFEYLPEDGSDYEGTGYWRFTMNYFLSAAELIRQDDGTNHFESSFLKNTFDYRLYQCAPNWEENIGFADVHDKRSSHSISAYYKIASEYNNGKAQWLGNLVRDNFLYREAYQSKVFPGILPEAFLELLWYNPEIEQQSPENLPLTKYFEAQGYSCQVETSGTFEIRVSDDCWVTVSPKVNMRGGYDILASAMNRANEIKHPVGTEQHIDDLKALLTRFKVENKQVYLQPISQKQRATELAIATCIENNWRLSVQVHKYIGIE